MRKEWMIFTFVALFLAGIGIGVLYSDYAGKPQAILPPQPQVCANTEELLNKKLNQYEQESTAASVHLERAKIYADLSDRGCPENSEEYRTLALQEISISRTLNDAARKTAKELRGIVDEYNRSDIKAGVDQALDKAKKLTDPAIDFMLQVEKIIREE